MTCDARQIANWFVLRAAKDDRSLSIMSLLKLSYIAHGWRLALHDEALFHNRIEAWQYGPVIPDIYHAFRQQGITVSKPVPIIGNSDELDQEVKRFLGQIYDIYGAMPPLRLSKLTHIEGGPWHIARNLGGRYAEIPDELIKLHYVNKKLAADRSSDI